MFSLVLESLLSGGTAGIIAAGFSKFMGDRSNEHLRAELASKLEETKHALEIESRKVQSLLNKRHFVSRARFEAEFEAMKQVHAGVATLQRYLLSTRPTFDVAPQNETAAERRSKYQQRASNLFKARDELLSVNENLRPFYTDLLYEPVSRCLQAAATEALEIQTTGTYEEERYWWEQ